ncbi:nucleotide-binding universal stress UspA family protein [Salirhabdus euzebyi]|uniref:Universal stress protein n=1 Tax=Salirhabdus euzebyi TaxID=394506 RepID=A0A841Q1I9_9BACI|nr:universal stress protein [Salirhabdus euzebyi]MBB6452113.1 nucleotide-binding universal stress UspA family protein [Salirhabdus euzebyi]
MAYQKILVAVDGSDASTLAFQKAVKMAQTNNAKMILAHVIDTNVYGSVVGYDLTFAQRAEKYANELLNDFKKMAEEAGVQDVIIHLDYGSPKAKIAKDIAPQFDADLIVCGATGHNAVERFLIGSVSEHITRYAKVDVLVARS